MVSICLGSSGFTIWLEAVASSDACVGVLAADLGDGEDGVGDAACIWGSCLVLHTGFTIGFYNHGHYNLI